MEPFYVPSPALLKLISDIAHAPALDCRLWAGVTLAIKMDSLHPALDAAEHVLAIVGAALAGSVAAVNSDATFGGGDCAELVLAIMAVDDVNARRVALEALIVTTPLFKPISRATFSTVSASSGPRHRMGASLV